MGDRNVTCSSRRPVLALVGLFMATSDPRPAAGSRTNCLRPRAGEQETLKQLHEMTEAIQHPRSLDWNRVRMSLRAETADGPPLAGVSIDLNHWTEQNSKSIITRGKQRGRRG